MRKLTLLVFIFLLVLAAACGSASPTPSTNDQPTEQNGYPVPQDTAVVDYPPAQEVIPTDAGYPVPGGAPALESRANVKVEFVEQAVDETNPAQVIIKVKLIAASPAEGSPDRFTPLIGQQIDLRTDKEGLLSLSPGDQFTADVVFRGDETNGFYFAENLQK